MKKLLFLLVTVLAFNLSNAQTVNGFNIEDIPAKYIEIVSTSKMFKPFEVTVYVDYGQISKMKEMSKGHVLDADGKLYSFPGANMAVLNFFISKGYKYTNQYIVTAGNQNVYHLLLENTNYKK